MQFLDKVKISLESWKGGDGCVSWRREAGVPYGGPSGGNGGNWGAVILQSSKDVNTLLEYKYKKNYKADPWEPWRSKEQYWANAENLNLKVPVGTLVTEVGTGRVLHYFSQDGEKFPVLHWGSGGLWNIEFKTATLQYPNFAILGEPGQIVEVELELQLMGDVALVWSPSVGKSTIINALANTKAKVADYHFTTLVPHLGSVRVNDFSFNLVDIPGLIKGASQGKWLWNEFLRHVLKAKIFCIVMDMYEFDKGIQEGVDLILEIFLFIQKKVHTEKEFKVEVTFEDEEIFLNIRKEKELFMQKQIMFAFNKFDLIQDEELVQEYQKTFVEEIKKLSFKGKQLFSEIDRETLEKNIFIISAATHHNLEKMLDFWASRLGKRSWKEYTPSAQKDIVKIDEEERCIVQDITKDEKEILLEGGYLEEIEMKFSKVRYVDNREFARMVYTTQRWNDEAEMYFWSKLDQEWLLEVLKESWARKGDVLKIKSHYPGYDDRYIQR